MSEAIPEDIKSEVTRVLRRFGNAILMSPGNADEFREDLALSLLAERERCAKACEDEAKECDWPTSGTLERVAAMIRKGDCK